MLALQSASLAQLLEHARPAAPHKYGEHETAPESTHVPVPLHVSFGDALPPVQLADAQTVPLG